MKSLVLVRTTWQSGLGLLAASVVLVGCGNYSRSKEEAALRLPEEQCEREMLGNVFMGHHGYSWQIRRYTAVAQCFRNSPQRRAFYLQMARDARECEESDCYGHRKTARRNERILRGSMSIGSESMASSIDRSGGSGVAYTAAMKRQTEEMQERQAREAQRDLAARQTQEAAVFEAGIRNLTPGRSGSVAPGADGCVFRQRPDREEVKTVAVENWDYRNRCSTDISVTACTETMQCEGARNFRVLLGRLGMSATDGQFNRWFFCVKGSYWSLSRASCVWR
jgi:hypothetical protein